MTSDPYRTAGEPAPTLEERIAAQKRLVEHLGMMNTPKDHETRERQLAQYRAAQDKLFELMRMRTSQPKMTPEEKRLVDEQFRRFWKDLFGL